MAAGGGGGGGGDAGGAAVEEKKEEEPEEEEEDDVRVPARLPALPPCPWLLLSSLQRTSPLFMPDAIVYVAQDMGFSLFD